MAKHLVKSAPVASPAKVFEFKNVERTGPIFTLNPKNLAQNCTERVGVGASASPIKS